MDSKILDKIKEDALSIIASKAEGVKMSTSIEEMIDNELCEVMSCPSSYGLEELSDCTRHSCKECWQHAVRNMY